MAMLDNPCFWNIQLNNPLRPQEINRPAEDHSPIFSPPNILFVNSATDDFSLNFWTGFPNSYDILQKGASINLSITVPIDRMQFN